MVDEGLDRLLALAQEQRQLTRLPQIIDGRPSIVTIQQHALSSPAGCQLDAMTVHIGEYVRNRTDILARLGHQRSESLTNIGGIAAAFRERLLVPLAPHTAFKSRAGINRCTAELVAEQARSDDVGRLVNGDQAVLIVGTFERSEEFVVFI